MLAATGGNTDRCSQVSDFRRRFVGLRMVGGSADLLSGLILVVSCWERVHESIFILTKCSSSTVRGCALILMRISRI